MSERIQLDPEVDSAEEVLALLIEAVRLFGLTDEDDPAMEERSRMFATAHAARHFLMDLEAIRTAPGLQ